jgi:hypothetical protein
MADTEQIVLREKDLDLLEKVQEGLLKRKAQPPQWREITLDRMKIFRDQVEGILIMLVPPAELKKTAERLSDALVGIGLLQPFLRDPNVDARLNPGSRQFCSIFRMGPVLQECFLLLWTLRL